MARAYVILTFQSIAVQDIGQCGQTPAAQTLRHQSGAVSQCRLGGGLAVLQQQRFYKKG